MIIARVWALSAIVPNLDGPRKEEMMEKALDIASKNSRYDSSKAEALSAIVPYLDGQKKEKADGKSP